MSQATQMTWPQQQHGPRKTTWPQVVVLVQTSGIGMTFDGIKRHDYQHRFCCNKATDPDMTFDSSQGPMPLGTQVTAQATQVSMALVVACLLNMGMFFTHLGQEAPGETVDSSSQPRTISLNLLYLKDYVYSKQVKLVYKN